MAEPTLHLSVRTPGGVAFEGEAHALRVPAASGQVGLRPRSEPTALDVEPGLLLVHAAEGLRFVATAGGLLRCDGRHATVLTPLAVAGGSAAAVRSALDDAFRSASADLQLRNVLERLERGLLQELHRAGPAGAT